MSGPTATELTAVCIGRLDGHIVPVTPEMARSWLEVNIGNRKLRGPAVRDYARAMRAGEFKATHQGVAFGTNGMLLDGQHRLSAVIATGLTVPMVIFLNADPDSFPNIDTHAKRSMRDLLKADGRIVDACAVFYRAFVGKGNVSGQPYEVNQVMDVLGPFLLDMNETAKSKPGRRGTAVVRAAVALRMATEKPANRSGLLKQWRAFLNLHFDDMDSVIRQLVKQVTDLPGAHEQRTLRDRFFRVWLAFDPKNKGWKRLQVNDPESLRIEVLASFEALRPGAPLSDRLSLPSSGAVSAPTEMAAFREAVAEVEGRRVGDG